MILLRVSISIGYTAEMLVRLWGEPRGGAGRSRHVIDNKCTISGIGSVLESVTPLALGTSESRPWTCDSL